MQKLFALDIGTRSVVGIILEHQHDQFHVADILVKEHKERAMVDGQIHNVVLVADLIKEIKCELEQVHGPLTKVSVAAAGRSLKTEQASTKIDIKNRPIFTEEDISRLELQAVQQAQQQLLQNKDDMTMTHYYCVGYSVLFYRLDGEEIGNLVDQQGNEAEVEVIATFLPRVVVESLLAALKRADLEMDALTLEPIAAINVLIPPTMRRLNVALVDIGAGTSDIAITNQGTVVAYGMVPTAGDEITEALSDHYLLDFPIAEQTKRKLHTEDEILIQDILGFDQYFPRNDVINTIQPSIEQLASAISSEILRLNNQNTPKAVMLVGGGSLTPRITTEIGKVLNLPENRVAVRGIDAIQNLTKDDSIPVTPELVTPIGIAIAAKKSPVQYISVTVNEQIVRLFELKEMTVSDAFLAANIRAKKLYGKPGQALSITVNNQSIFIPGEHGVPSTIYVNGEAASTKTLIKSGDIISLEIGRDGKKAEAQVKDLIDPALTKELTINGQPYTLTPKIYVNNKLAIGEQYLQDRDNVTIKIAETVEQVLEACNYTHISKNIKSYQIILDNTSIHLPQFSTEIYLNGAVTKLTYPVKNGDTISFDQSAVPTAKNVANQLNIHLDHRIVVTFQGESVELYRNPTEVYINGQPATLDTIIKSGSTVKFTEKNDEKWIFQDIFRFSDWQIPANFKGQFLILRNGEEASFDTQIFGGDVLQIELIPSNQPHFS